MQGPMREIKVSQIHRRTGARRRFIISQFDRPARTAESAGASDRVATDSVGSPRAWHYVAQSGDDASWSRFRRLNVASDATDDEVRTKAIRDHIRRALNAES
jgi:hypothetical protein